MQYSSWQATSALCRFLCTSAGFQTDMCRALSTERHLLLRRLHSRMCYKCSYPQQMLQMLVPQTLFRLFTRPKDVPTRPILPSLQQLALCSTPGATHHFSIDAASKCIHDFAFLDIMQHSGLHNGILEFWTWVACPDGSRKSHLNSPSMSCSIQLFIPASWETTDLNSAALNRRAELWGEIDSPAGTQYFFPTIGFVSSLYLAPA